MIAFVLGVLLAQPQPETAGPPSPAAESTPGPVRGRMPPRPPSLPAIPPGAAVIANSGSTNTASYTIIILPDGTTTVRQYEVSTNGTVATAQTHWFFSRLHAAQPLASLGLDRCMKSASFGYSMTITWNGTTTRDVSCGADPASRELVRTISVIATQLAIPMARRPLRLRPL